MSLDHYAVSQKRKQKTLNGSNDGVFSYWCLSGLDPSFNTLEGSQYVSAAGYAAVFRWKFLFSWVRQKTVYQVQRKRNVERTVLLDILLLYCYFTNSVRKYSFEDATLNNKCITTVILFIVHPFKPGKLYIIPQFNFKQFQQNSHVPNGTKNGPQSERPTWSWHV